jgi:hypothetical protein
MGEASGRRRRKHRLLAAQPFCIYCGDIATTTDHCPARSWFSGRRWPEGYEFPACYECNLEGSADEQVLAVLVRIELDDDKDEFGRREFEKAVRGLKDSQPAVLAEMMAAPATTQKRYFRQAFGSQGDEIRHAGWAAATLGPLTKAALARSMLKLGRALCYMHLGAPFEGGMATRHCSRLQEADEFFDKILMMMPEAALPQRGNQDLTDQFIYRFNIDPVLGIFFAIVQFSRQFIFLILAASDNALKTFAEEDPSAPSSLADKLVDCRLKNKPVAV